MPSPLPTERARISFRFLYLLLGLLCAWDCLGWQIRAPGTTGNGDDYQTAFEKNIRGDLSEVYRDESGQVFLRVSLAPGFIKFSPSNCPTLQIDDRIPVHHNQTGAACVVRAESADISLGNIFDKLLISLPLHRLMNGSQLAVRFVTSSGEYREALFSLSNSKQAMKSAIGSDIRVEPEPKTEPKSELGPEQKTDMVENAPLDPLSNP